MSVIISYVSFRRLAEQDIVGVCTVTVDAQPSWSSSDAAKALSGAISQAIEEFKKQKGFSCELVAEVTATTTL